MGNVYFAIPLLALYGDVVKRFVPPLVALGILYGSAVLILVMIAFQIRGRGSRVIGRDARIVNGFVFMLIGTYVLQFFTSFDAVFLKGLSHLLYMVIPLSYIIVVQKYCPQFSLEKLANIFLWLMIPVNIVGIIQYAINPEFLISTVYSGDLGGVIQRNLIDRSYFNRFPSIFVSADRYSAMALMQFFFYLVLMMAKSPISRWGYLWLTFNLISSFVALGVAGARSRILIVLVEVVLISAVQIVAFSRGSIHREVRGRVLMFTGVCAVVFGVALFYFSASEKYPIVLFLQQSLYEGDIKDRVRELLLLSKAPEDISLFGAGLGTTGEGGKPGEFGIKSTWAESGLVWGGLILISFLGIMAVLAKCSLKVALKGQGVRLAIISFPLLMLTMALLTGLTAVFELSAGILMASTIAVAVRQPSVRV